MEKTILSIDDDPTTRRLIAQALRQRLSFRILEAENGQAGMRLLKSMSYVDLILLDLHMPVMDGFQVLERLAKEYPNIPVIILTGAKTTDDVVAAMRAGAIDFLSKPIEPERLYVSVKNALKISKLSEDVSRLKRQAGEEMRFSDLIGHDSGLKDAVYIGRKASASDIPILLSGETGTGKDMFARAIHGESERNGAPFVPINCGAIPEKLIESTLFGHEKGAFTGAIASAPGKFREADGGTIFLDEVGELPPEAQVRLLRVLQQREVEPVGAARAFPVNVRVISATHKDLNQEVQEGRFREDLYFRLNILQIILPPLRTRTQDIEKLCELFISAFATSHAVPKKTLSSGAIKALEGHNWPGNVRELENVINRSMVLCEEESIMAQHLNLSASHSLHYNRQHVSHSADVIQTLTPDGNFRSLKEIEEEVIQKAVAHHDYNMSKTARVLGIAKSTLYSKAPN